LLNASSPFIFKVTLPTSAYEHKYIKIWVLWVQRKIWEKYETISFTPGQLQRTKQCSYHYRFKFGLCTTVCWFVDARSNCFSRWVRKKTRKHKNLASSKIFFLQFAIFRKTILMLSTFSGEATMDIRSNVNAPWCFCT
jgi:hypothetical protein